MRAFICIFLACTAAYADDPKYEYRDPAKNAVDVKKPTLWKANLTAGLVWIAGNSSSVGLSVTGAASMKHWNNEVSLFVGGAFVYAGISPYGTGGPITDNDKQKVAGNWALRLRYDRYFLVKNTVFAYFQASGDPFAGFEHRLQGQLGYARLFWQSVHQTFRGEVGFDYMHEYRVQPASCTARPCRIFDYYNGRLFLFYENKFTPWASFSEGLELLEAFNRPEAFRLNSLTSLSSMIAKNFALKLNFKLAFNNDPPARPAPSSMNPMFTMYPPDQTRFEKVDTQLDVVLAVTFL